MKIVSCQPWFKLFPYQEYSLPPRTGQHGHRGPRTGAHSGGVCLRLHGPHHSFPALPWAHLSLRAKQKHIPPATLGITPSELRIATGPAHINKGSPGLSGHKSLHCSLHSSVMLGFPWGSGLRGMGCILPSQHPPFSSPFLPASPGKAPWRERQEDWGTQADGEGDSLYTEVERGHQNRGCLVLSLKEGLHALNFFSFMLIIQYNWWFRVQGLK